MQYMLGSDAMLKNNWNVVLSAIYKPVNYSNSILQGGPRFRYSEDFFKSVSVTSDSRKKLRYSIAVFNNRGKNNSFSYSELNFGLNYQPIDAFVVSVNPVLSSNKNKLQYISQTNVTTEPRYITANMNQDTFSASVRFDFNINPNFTIQYYGQPFISKGKYNQFNKVTDPSAEYYKDRISLFSENQIGFNETKNTYDIDEDTNGTVDYSISNPDFSFVQFRSNLVARWEYIPGSEIFLVWSQGITSNGNPNENLFTELDSQILGRKPTNTFLIKMTYRFML